MTTRDWPPNAITRQIMVYTQGRAQHQETFSNGEFGGQFFAALDDGAPHPIVINGADGRVEIGFGDLHVQVRIDGQVVGEFVDLTDHTWRTVDLTGADGSAWRIQYKHSDDFEAEILAARGQVTRT